MFKGTLFAEQFVPKFYIPMILCSKVLYSQVCLFQGFIFLEPFLPNSYEGLYTRDPLFQGSIFPDHFGLYSQALMLHSFMFQSFILQQPYVLRLCIHKVFCSKVLYYQNPWFQSSILPGPIPFKCLNTQNFVFQGFILK